MPNIEVEVVKRKQLLVREPNETNFGNEKSSRYLTTLLTQSNEVIKKCEKPYKHEPAFKPVQKECLVSSKTRKNSKNAKSQHVQNFSLINKFNTKISVESCKANNNSLKAFESKPNIRPNINPISKDLYSKLCSK
jgi:hypothetical protein